MRTILAALCAAFLLAVPAAAITNHSDLTLPESGVDKLRSALQDVVEQARAPKPDESAIAASLKAIIADPAFSALRDEEQHAAYLLYASVLYDLGDKQGTEAAVRTATQMRDAGAVDWSLRTSNSFTIEDYQDAIRSMTMLALHWPDELSQFSDDAFFRLGREAAQSPDQTVYAAYLDALRAAHWHPSDPFTDADALWLPLLRMRLEKGDRAGAQELAAELRDPESIIEMHADKRYDVLIAADPGRYDVAKAYADALADMRAKSAAGPDKLKGVNAVAYLLLKLNHPEDGLKLIDATLAGIKAKPAAFTDTDDELPWLMDLRADALFVLARSDEAFATMREAAARKEHGGVNVSEAINLAEMDTLFDRPKDALAAVADIGFPDASDYGRMALEDARACALQLTGDTAKLKPVLDYMKAHVRDGAQPFLNTMLCTGDLDGAAAEVVAELNDPARRGWMLYVLQDYPPDPHSTRRQLDIHAAWQALRARPDVAAAIARVGRIESYDVRNPGY